MQRLLLYCSVSACIISDSLVVDVVSLHKFAFIAQIIELHDYLLCYSCAVIFVAGYGVQAGLTNGQHMKGNGKNHIFSLRTYTTPLSLAL